MPFQAFMRALKVPIFIIVMTGLYWLSIHDASSSAQRVPRVVIIFILIMTLIVVIREMLYILKEKRSEINEPLFLSNIGQWYWTNRQRCVFAMLSLVYIPLFIYLGYNVANFIFLSLALPLSGLGKKRGGVSRALLCLVVSLFASAIFHILALVMDFNVPVSPLGI